MKSRIAEHLNIKQNKITSWEQVGDYIYVFINHNTKPAKIKADLFEATRFKYLERDTSKICYNCNSYERTNSSWNICKKGINQTANTTERLTMVDFGCVLWTAKDA